jgi:hypothetical protein
MATSLHGNKKAQAKLATANCQETHTTKDLCQPGGVTQLTRTKVLNLYQQTRADKLGQWVWQEFQTNEKFNLYVITAYRICPQPPSTSAMTTTWHQQK